MTQGRGFRLTLPSAVVRMFAFEACEIEMAKLSLEANNNFSADKLSLALAALIQAAKELDLSQKQIDHLVIRTSEIVGYHYH